MAGMTTQINLAADQPGTFLGENTQFSGTGFPQQKFTVIALPQAGFALWLQHARQGAPPLDAAAYAALLAKSTPPQPLYFAPVSPGLFQHILAQTRGAGMDMAR
jgi:cytochrome o ubiquinol oxidase subunit 2